MLFKGMFSVTDKLRRERKTQRVTYEVPQIVPEVLFTLLTSFGVPSELGPYPRV